MLADWMDLPTVTTFEHPVVENGELPNRLEELFPTSGQRFTKRTYDCTLEMTINQAVKRLPVSQIAVVGAETDVCVMQSVLGLLRMEYQVFLLEDCLFTTEPNPSPALKRMYNSGVVPCTLRSFTYELLQSVDHTPWSETWIDRDRDYAKQLPERFDKNIFWVDGH